MEAKMDWKKKEYSFFSHKKCEYFPCHKTDDPDNFNCLFCYCPLYALGKKCGGNYRYTESGIKDCSNCLIPHKRENYEYITGKYQEIIKMMKLQKEEK
ncbi:MAG TPA: cysteine-rich small domain-containing protein [Candidatus Blautia avistercoris]|nr:cysteine-rich small domain-containing protein [Candidatus Blautia avistercoris]